jgi:hypothetical protein
VQGRTNRTGPHGHRLDGRGGAAEGESSAHSTSEATGPAAGDAVSGHAFQSLEVVPGVVPDSDPSEHEAAHVARQIMSGDGGSLALAGHGGSSGNTDLGPGLSSPGAPLPGSARAFFEPRFGHDFSRVRLHTDSEAARSAASLSARAYTVGQHVVFGAGQYAPSAVEGRHVLAHELTHTLQAPRFDSSGPMVQRLPMGPMGGGGPEPEPEWRKKAGLPEDYVRKHGLPIVDALRAQMSNAAFAPGVPAVAWASGGPQSFNEAFNLELFQAKADVWRFLVSSLEPEDVGQLVDRGRDAVSLPDQAMQWNNGVVFQLANAYTRRISDSLARLVPRYVMVWNQHVLAEEAKDTGTKRKPEDPLPSAPEPHGADVRTSNPLDPFVLRALERKLAVDFKQYRQTNPAEQRVHAVPGSRAVTLEIQWQQKAINWVRATPPDATAEEVAAALYGSETMAYLITPAAPLFGFDTSGPNKAKLVQRYRDELDRIQSNTSYHGSPGGSPAAQVLAGPLADEAAINQAKGVAKPTPGISKAVVVERMRNIVAEFNWLQTSVARWSLQSTLEAAKQQVDARSRQIDGEPENTAGTEWDSQSQSQLHLLGSCRNAVKTAIAQEDVFKGFPGATGLINRLAMEYVEAAAMSGLVESARSKLAVAEQKSRQFPADLMEMVLDAVRPNIESAKREKTVVGDVPAGNIDPERYGSGDLATRENELRFALTKVRELLLQNPEQAKAELDRLLKEITSLSTEVTLVSNLDSCDAAWMALYQSLSTVGAGVGVFSDDHGNPLLIKDMKAVNQMHGEWHSIYVKWKYAGTPELKKEAEDELHTKAKSKEWTDLFKRIGDHISDTATLNKWVTFGAMVGIAIVTGGLGAYVEAAAGLAWGAAAGFAVATVTEAAAFSAMSYPLLAKDPSFSGLWDDFQKNVLMFGALKGIGKIYVGMVGEAAAAEAMGKLGGVAVQFTAVNGHALYVADQDKRKRTGKGLTEDEIIAISFENLAFISAVAVGSALAKPFLPQVKLPKALEGEVAAARNAREKAAAIAKAVEGTKGKDAKKARELNASLSDALAKEEAVFTGAKEKVKAYESGDTTALTEADYKELKLAMQEHEANLLEFQRGQIASLLEPAGSDHFLVARGALERVVQHYSTVEKGTKVAPVGEPDPVTGARTVEITPPAKEGPPWRVTERVSASAGQIHGPADPAAGPAVAGGKPRVTEPVPGLFEGIDAAPKVSDWKIVDDTTLEGDTKVITTQVTTPDGKSGWIERAYNPNTKTFEMRNAFLDDLPKWVKEGGPSLDPAKGTPTVTYLTIRQMKLAGVDYAGAQTVKMSTIQNVRAVIEFNAQLAQGVAPEAAVMNTHSIQYAETSIVQSGSKITGATVGGAVCETPLKVMLEWYETHSGHRSTPDPDIVAKHDLLIAKHGQGVVTRDTVVKWNYDIYLKVAPFGGK